MSSKTSLIIRISGIVQGVGFRPFIYRVATRSGVKGYVRNMGGSEVEVRIEGEVGQVSNFLKLLFLEKPPPAKLEKVVIEESQFNGFDGFTILPSGKDKKLYSMIPPDIAVCDGCIEEVYDPSDRHYMYAFNSCAWCGPRFSMMRSVPYDRQNTSMYDFPLCDECRKEYEDPSNIRRFHAQGISCPKCGPSLWLEDSEGKRIYIEDPILEAARLIDSGAIIAIKGLGGYHIACLATDDSIIRKLRERKKRPYKPLALMALNLDTVERYLELNDVGRMVLTSPERPILLLPKKRNSGLSDLIAPGLDTVGVMLPYTPLHHMILNETEDKILIMTSGNEYNKPMCTSIECARKRLSKIVDYFLHHDREIVNRVDDSVVRFTAGRITMLRRGRGYAPAWIRLPSQLNRPIIAFGAELQTSGAVGFSDKVVLTQYIGDTYELENLEFLERMLSFFSGVYGINPAEAVLVADLHPFYSTRRLAERWANLHGSELQLVQHHHAHIVSVMAEIGVRPGERAVGIAVDGLGYGDDGTLWGGEVLLAGYSEYKRVGHLKPQPMPGGDRASRYPIRMLIGILSTFLSESEIWEVLRERQLVDKLPGGETEVSLTLKQCSKSPLISSVGRVLDSISALLGICIERTYEGEPAMKLEAFAGGGSLIQDINVPVEGGIVDTSELLRQLLYHEGDGKDLAYTSIYLLGMALGEVALKALNRADSDIVMVSGGAAVNSVLIKGIEDVLKREDVQLVLNSKVPPGDGGIALGQVAAQLGDE